MMAGRCVETFALRYHPGVGAVGTAMQEHPALLRNAPFAGLADRGHQDRRRLVDDGIGVHQARVGETDPAIVVGDRGQPFSAVAFASSRQRIVLGDCRQAFEQPAHGHHVAADVALQTAADGVLQQGIEMDRGAQLVPRLLVGKSDALVADPGRLTAGILVPVDREAGLARVLRRAQQLGAADQRQLGLAVRDFLGKAIDEVLGHVAPGVGVEQLPWHGMQTVCDALGRVGAAAERRSEARADIGEEFEHGHGIDLAAKGVRADRGSGIVDGEACCLGAERDIRPLAGRLAGRVGDLAASDQDGRTGVDHFRSASTSAALSPASASTLFVCSPRSATLGPLCRAEPEKRKGGAGDL